MVVKNNNINKILSQIFSIITIFQIFNSIKADIPQESMNNAQGISRIIYIGEIKYRYINFASYSNGDMVVETTCYPEGHKRMFFGLKENGRPFFKDNNNEKLYYSINVEGEAYKKFEADSLIIKLSNNDNNGKEYYFSISKLECNAELFDFDNNKVYTKDVNSFTTFFNTDSLRNAFISLSNSNYEN